MSITIVDYKLSNYSSRERFKIMKLGKLTEVDVRTIWPHEQYDFSKWLASEENIQELGDLLNLTLTEVETEKFVGSYRCDIIQKMNLPEKTS